MTRAQLLCFLDGITLEGYAEMSRMDALVFRRRFALAWIRNRDGDAAADALEGRETGPLVVRAFLPARNPEDAQDQGIAETFMMKVIASVDPAYDGKPPPQL